MSARNDSTQHIPINSLEQRPSWIRKESLSYAANSSSSMKTEDFLLCSHEKLSVPIPSRRNKSTPSHPISFRSISMLSTISTDLVKFSTFKDFWLKFCMHYPSLPSVLHASPSHPPPSKLQQVVTLLTCIQEVQLSNLCRDTKYT